MFTHYLWLLLFTMADQNVRIDSLWLTKPKTLTIWSFIEKFAKLYSEQ